MRIGKMSGRLTDGFREVLDLKWSEFCEMEKDPKSDNFSSIISILVRACANGKIKAIKTALDRMDGKVAMEIEVEYPKFYTIYPNATICADSSDIIDLSPIDTNKTSSPSKIERDDTPEPPTTSLRDSLDKLLYQPKNMVADILIAAGKAEHGDFSNGDPMVKSVIVCGLMNLVHNGDLGAVFEVFDQIDGKVADTIKVLGDDVYIYNYASIAPAGAVKNSDGMYQIESDNMTNSWAARLEASRLR